MKLNPEAIEVTSFETSESIVRSGTGTYEPTPMTFCYWCPPKTIDTIDPIGTIDA